MPSEKQAPYIVPLETSLDESGEVSYLPASLDTLLPNLIRDEDGYFLSGLSITVDSAPEAWPKRRFTFQFKFVVEETNCNLLAYDGEMRFAGTTDDAATWQPLYEEIEQKLIAVFRQPPWATREQRSGSIGFVELKSHD